VYAVAEVFAALMVHDDMLQGALTPKKPSARVESSEFRVENTRLTPTFSGWGKLSILDPQL
jgi:hypothetical protein